jgi:anti-sigma factor RsiW
MNCHEIHPMLHAYVDSELDLMPSLEVDRHLKTCAACTAMKRSLESLRATLRNNDLAYRAPESLRARIRQSVAVTAEERPRRNSRPWVWQLLTLGSLGFAVFTLMLQPAGSFSSQNQLADEAISDHVRSLMAEHLMDVVSTDQHTVKPWFNGKIDFAPEVKDLAAQGFPLIGGRLDYLEGQTVAALVYNRNKHTINAFVWPAKTAAATTTIQERRGYTVINRDANGLHYCIVSDLNAKELQEFGNLLTQ